jgi:HAD superfamily hydrolase (TIGR01509 family)
VQAAGVGLEAREIVDTLSAQVIAEVRREVPWRPGARELLDELHTAGIRCALVTMSEGPLAGVVVESLPKPYFEFMVTGDTVTNGKPHPEAYLTAVERLRLDDPSLTIHHCVALEDSVPGATAAIASGVVTVGIPHQVPLPEDPRMITWPTLAGRTTSDVEQLVFDRFPSVNLVEGAN